MTTTNSNDPTAEFAEFFLDETSRLEIELPGGDPMLYNGQPVAVNLYGPSTAQHVAAREKAEREATKRVFANMAKGSKKKDEPDTDADAKFLCAITASFENFPYPGGAEAIYRQPRLKYINNQVNAHLADLGNFFKKSKTT